MHSSATLPANPAGLYTMALRWVIGWTYFSAFWRRLVLDNKLIPDEAGYIGEKFNHFLPHALGIKPLIEYLVLNPDALLVAMVVFTLVEALVGAFLILGLFTRLMSIGVVLLAMGILLGSGWLGTTCLDEWQIGVLGVAGGFTLFLSGSGSFSLDQYMLKRQWTISQQRWYPFLGSGILPIKQLKAIVFLFSVGILSLTLYTNQYFHGGVLGTLHNKSVRPKVEILPLSYNHEALVVQLYRTEGADVYGSFLIGIDLRTAEGKVLKEWSQQDLSRLRPEQIRNHYVAKIQTGKHSLILPLGAKADITLPLEGVALKQDYLIHLTDISGLTWQAPISN